MATQTGSIDLTASNSVKLAAEAGWQSDLDDYYTKSEIDVTVGGISSEVSKKVNGTEIISTINQSAESVSINASKINLTGAVTISDLSSDAQSATLNSNISVGGRNLLRDTDILRTGGSYWFFAGGNTIAVTTNNSDPDGGNNATLVTVSGAADHFIAYRAQPITELGWYTFSIWMKASAAHNLRLTLENNDGYRKTCALTTSWQRFDMSFDITTLSTTNYLIIGGYSSWTGATPNIYFYHPKLEKDKVATDWTPAPEDVDSAISDAAKTATSYVTEVTGQNGIMVHPSTDDDTGVQITDDVDIMRSGTSVINIGTNDAVRIGVDDNSHVKMLLESNAMAIENERDSEIFSIDSGSTGTSKIAVAATLVTWSTTASVNTTAYSVSDTGTASGTATVTATIDGIDYTLGSTYATVTVTAGTGVSVALTSAGVTYVRGLMVVTVVITDDAGESTVTTTYPCELSVEYQHTITDKALLSLIGGQTITGEGDVLYVINNKWTSTRHSNALIRVRNSVTGREIKVGVGSDGYSRGLWDTSTNNWIIYRNNNNQTVIHGANFSVSASGNIAASGAISSSSNINASGAISASGTMSSGYQVSVKGTGSTSATKRVIALRSNSAGNRGLYDVSLDKWILFKNQRGEIAFNDPIHLYSNTCTVNSTNASIYNSTNYCRHNYAVVTITIAVNLKASLANGSAVDVATAPANYRPPFAVMGSVYVTGVVANLQAEILSSGVIKVNNRSGSAVSTSANIYMSFTFTPA